MLEDILSKSPMIMGLILIFCYISNNFECLNAIITYLLVSNFVESKGE